MSQCCPSLFNKFWNVIVPWWVSWTTMIPDTKKCGGGRLHWLSLRPRTTPPWHYHSDCINFYRHQSRMVSLSHRFRVLEGLPLFLLVTMAQFPKVPLSLTQSSGAFHKACHPWRPGPLRVSVMMMLALEVSCFMWICGPFNGLWTDHCNWDGQPSDCDENINKCILSESQPELCTNWLLKMATTNSNKGENYVKWQIKMD